MSDFILQSEGTCRYLSHNFLLFPFLLRILIWNMLPCTSLVVLYVVPQVNFYTVVYLLIQCIYFVTDVVCNIFLVLYLFCKLLFCYIILTSYRIIHRLESKALPFLIISSHIRHKAQQNLVKCLRKSLKFVTKMFCPNMKKKNHQADVTRSESFLFMLQL